MQTDWNISKLKQNLEVWNRTLERLSPSQRRLVLLLGGGLLLILFYLAVVNPLLNLGDSWSRELANRSKILTKYQMLIESKPRVLTANKAMKVALTRTEGQFLAGASPAVASADLQEIVKNLSKDHGVQMNSAKVLPPREAGPYTEVPVQVDLTATLGQLVALLHHLEHHKKLLFITDLRISAPFGVKADKKVVPLRINLVVSGVIKKGVSS